MACVAEALGIMLPGGASAPAVTADRIRIAEQTGATAVALAKSGLRPDKTLTGKAFENAFRVLLAIGGSTNAVVHLSAMVGRLGIASFEAKLFRPPDAAENRPGSTAWPRPQ